MESASSPEVGSRPEGPSRGEDARGPGAGTLEYCSLKTAADSEWRQVRVVMKRVGGPLLAAGIVLAIGVLVLPVRKPTVSLRARCLSNLHQVSIALTMYGAERGMYPPHLAQLVQDGYLPAGALVCPATSDTEAPGTSAAARARAVRSPAAGCRHCSYVFVAAGKPYADRAPGAVVLYDPPGNHKAGMWALFADGHHQEFDLRQAQALIAETRAGHNPPRPEKLK